MSNFKKRFIVTLASLFVVVIVFISAIVIFSFQSFAVKNFRLGVNFSESYAQYLGLDWQKTYLAILDDLKVKNIRLAAPWNAIEPSFGNWNFTNLDWEVNQASQRGVNIILIVGRRTPHWPECHDPSWLKDLSASSVQDKQFAMLETVVDRYKNNPSIKIWQVENEPLLDVFGECPPSDINLLKKEISFVKTLDPSRKILVTDSGELSLWAGAANVSDLFGTTMYRVTYNKLLGYFYYHLPTFFYNSKARFVGRDPASVIVAELQGEPWAPNGILNTSLDDQRASMDAERLVSHVNYAKSTGFGSAYLWGAEWWYWLKEKQGDNSLWDAAKALF